ncbi:MAG: hypothetical protein LC114_07800 [Bryobacterales bacterium]|nr:hypothetical protein [Bryobacterales bacterium]
MKTDKHISTDLTPAQTEMIAALMSGSNVTEASKRAGISRATHYLWMKTSADYVSALNSAKTEHLEATRAQLLALADEAVSTVRELLSGGEDVPAAVRLKAALEVLRAVGALEPTPPGPTDISSISVAQMLGDL